jgi:hypothetical protein
VGFGYRNLMSIVVTPIPRLIDLAVPAFTLGTANAAGAAETAVASNSTLLAFDAVVPDAITFGQSGDVGSAVVASRRDHAHAMEEAEEDGVWVPDPKFGGGDTGMSNSGGGFYVKVGRMVSFQGEISISNLGTDTGTLSIQGLPFTSRDSANGGATVALFINRVSYADNCQASILLNTSEIVFAEQPGGGGSYNAITNSDCEVNTYIIVSGVYEV